VHAHMLVDCQMLCCWYPAVDRLTKIVNIGSTVLLDL
jgi:hypothetical protein